MGSAEIECPELKADDPTPLKLSMILAIKPRVYVKDVARMRFGVSVLVADTGCEAFTPLDAGHGV